MDSNDLRHLITENNINLVSYEGITPIYSRAGVAESAEVTGPQRALVSQYLSTAGDGTGTTDAIGNYAVDTQFYIQPAAGDIIRIRRLMVRVQDTGTFSGAGYGAGAALTVGVIIKQLGLDDVVISDITKGVPVKLNGDWTNFGEVDISTFAAGDNYVQAIIDFEASGQMIRLIGDNNEKLQITLKDNFTGLVAQTFLAQGYIE